MRNLFFVVVTATGIYLAARWWRQHPRTGSGFMNRIVNPWLEGHHVVHGSRGELALIEHVGRKSGTVRSTPIHPMRTADGFRIIVPVGDRSEWARNVLAAGRCRLLLGDEVLELDEPMLETPAQVPGLPRLACGLFSWLGFRYLHLRVADGGLPEDSARATRSATGQELVAV